MVYDFALWTLGQQIAADGYASFISGTTVRENRDYDFLNLVPGLPEGKAEKAAIDLSKIPTYTAPWEYSRFPSGISSLMAHGFRQDLARNEGIYTRSSALPSCYPADIILHGAFFWDRVFRMYPFVPSQRFSPALQRMENALNIGIPGACRTGKVPDYRFAAMYESLRSNGKRASVQSQPMLPLDRPWMRSRKKRKRIGGMSIEQLSQFYVDRCRDLRQKTMS